MPQFCLLHMGARLTGSDVYRPVWGGHAEPCFVHHDSTPDADHQIVLVGERFPSTTPARRLGARPRSPANTPLVMITGDFRASQSTSYWSGGPIG